MTLQHPYIPNTDADRAAMLQRIGVASAADLFADVPPAHRDPAIALEPALSEEALAAIFAALAARNNHAGAMLSFLGAGAEQHYVPSVVRHVLSRSEFATAYTPYQPEISQGTLQTAFEFQSMACEILGMDVANTGMYDGASALAEGCLMAVAITGRRRIAVLDGVHPNYVEVVRTYAAGHGHSVDVLPSTHPVLTAEHACLVAQQPAFLGTLADMRVLEGIAHGAGALYVVTAGAFSLGMVEAPGAYGADIAVTEGQPFGVPLAYGGPYVGMFTSRQKFIRQMPGRIVGRTRDLDCRTGYVLTLQTREQHIRREHATSNICTAEQLIALAVTVYLASIGPQGLRDAAEGCYRNAHYAASRIAALPGYRMAGDAPFFNEVAVHCPLPPAQVNAHLLTHGIIGGLDVSDRLPNGLLLCFTEMHRKADIDRLAEALASVGGAE